MDKQTLYNRLDPNLNEIADQAIADSQLITLLFGGMAEDNPRIKYGSSNTLILVCKKAPEVLYPFFDDFAQLLTDENQFVNRAGLIVLATLAKADVENKLDPIFDQYCASMLGPHVTAASYSIRGVGVIALAKPYLIESITQRLLNIEHAKYQTKACKDTALGFMISSFDLFFDQVKNKAEVIRLISQLRDNSRQATRNKAKKFIAKWGKIEDNTTHA